MEYISKCPGLLLLALILLTGPIQPAQAASFKMDTVVMPQPDETLKIRLTGAKELAAYVERIDAAAKESFRLDDKLQPTTGALVVAVKPGYQARFWLMSTEYFIPQAILDDFKIRFEKIRPVAVQIGPIAFAIRFEINGGGKPFGREDSPMPIPAEWRKAAESATVPLLIPDGFLPLVWPDETGPVTSPLTVPEGFELQTLDVTQGSILKPKDWFYKFSTDGKDILWTVSKEDPEPDGYKTGFALRLFPAVSKTLKETPKAAAKAFISMFEKSGKLMHKCRPEKVGDFTRACMETREVISAPALKGEYRVLYSTSWSDDLDMVTVSVFRTLYDEWDAYEEIRDQMTKVILIGEDFWKEYPPTRTGTADSDLPVSDNDTRIH
jgi:hypothetical protein